MRDVNFALSGASSVSLCDRSRRDHSGSKRCVFSSDPAVSSSIFVGAEREDNLIRRVLVVFR